MNKHGKLMKITNGNTIPKNTYILNKTFQLQLKKYIYNLKNITLFMNKSLMQRSTNLSNDRNY